MLLRVVLAVAATFGLTLAAPDLLDPRQEGTSVCSIKKKQGSVCNVRGAIIHPSYYTSVSGVNIQQCAQALKTTAGAKSAQWSYTGNPSPGDGQCNMFNETAKAQRFIPSKSYPQVFDKPCVVCQPCSTTFSNGGFDTGSLAPWKQSVTGTGWSASTVQPGYNGTAYAASLTAAPTSSDGSQSGSLQLSQTFQVCPNLSYTVTIYYQGDPNSSGAQLNTGVSSVNGGGSQGNGDFSGDWESTTLSFYATSSVTQFTIYISLYNYDSSASATVLIDDVSVEVCDGC